VADFSALSHAMDFWRDQGFEPWSLRGMEGVYRRLTFRKGAMLGEVARYCADDYLVWKHRGAEDAAWVFKHWKSAPDVAVHRWIFLEEAPAFAPRRRAMWLGLRGFLEIYPHVLHAPPHRQIKDIAWLIDNAWKQVQDSLEARG
jgi:hypothetical protein